MKFVWEHYSIHIYFSIVYKVNSVHDSKKTSLSLPAKIIQICPSTSLGQLSISEKVEDLTSNT